MGGPFDLRDPICGRRADAQPRRVVDDRRCPGRPPQLRFQETEGSTARVGQRLLRRPAPFGCRHPTIFGPLAGPAATAPVRAVCLFREEYEHALVPFARPPLEPLGRRRHLSAPSPPSTRTGGRNRGGRAAPRAARTRPGTTRPPRGTRTRRAASRSDSGTAPAPVSMPARRDFRSCTGTRSRRPASRPSWSRSAAAPLARASVPAGGACCRRTGARCRGRSSGTRPSRPASSCMPRSRRSRSSSSRSYPSSSCCGMRQRLGGDPPRLSAAARSRSGCRPLRYFVPRPSSGGFNTTPYVSRRAGSRPHRRIASASGAPGATGSVQDCRARGSGTA